MTLITRERMTAMCHLSRWRGWTTRPYSVGEHTAIGAYVGHWFKRSLEQRRRWWLHDMHETEVIGDVPTPDKSAYVNTRYFEAVERFDLLLGKEAGCTDMLWWRDDSVKNIDYKMLIVENDMIAVRKDPDLPEPDYKADPALSMIQDCINGGSFDTPEKVIGYWNKWAYQYGWDEL